MEVHQCNGLLTLDERFQPVLSIITRLSLPDFKRKLKGMLGGQKKYGGRERAFQIVYWLRYNKNHIKSFVIKRSISR
jgi:hypothetical protein